MSQRRGAWVAVAICLVLAALWLVVVPEQADEAEGPRFALLAFGHSVSWLLLAATLIAWLFDAPRAWVRALAYGAALSYAAFVAALVL